MINSEKIKIVLLTFVITVSGCICLFLSMTSIEKNAQKHLSDNSESSVHKGVNAIQDIEDEVTNVSGLDLPKDEKIILYKEVDANIEFETEQRTAFVYQGQLVEVKDSLLTKEEAVSNASIIMDFIYDYVNETILIPYEIDKKKYEYSIQRQYDNLNKVNYGVFLFENEDLVCTIGVVLEDEPELCAFARDGLIELYGNDKVIPEEYLIENWCMATEQRKNIYEEYLSNSKYIVEEVLGLPQIAEEYMDMDSVTYFNANDMWSKVTFGYVLEDGTYVKVFYNRVNKMWDGFAIAGYCAS